MHKQTDAVGYLLNLRDEVNLPWFTFLCDKAIASNDGNLTDRELEMLLGIFKGELTYLSAVKPLQPNSTDNNITQPPVIHLKELHSFSNFKKLNRNLRLTLNKRITIIFGANGTGKSSLCTALKILTMPKEPDTPIVNVKEPSSVDTSFVYKLSDPPGETLWDKSIGYGSFHNHIKYFDASIAVNMLSSAISTEIVSEVTPFKLEVFIYLNTMLSKFKTRIEQAKLTISTEIEDSINKIRMRLERFDNEEGQFIKTLDISNIPSLKKMLDSKTITAEEIILQHENDLQALIKASSPEGLQLLKNELKDYINFLGKLNIFFDTASKLIYDNIPITSKQLHEKKAAQKVFLERYINHEDDVGEFKKFIQSSMAVFRHEHKDGEKCPYCKQNLSPEAHALISSYNEFLSNDLEKEILQLQKDLSAFAAIKSKIQDFDISFVVDPPASINEMFSQEAKAIIQEVIKEASIEFENICEGNIKSYYKFKELLPISRAINDKIAKLNEIIPTSEENQESNNLKIQGIKNKIGDIRFCNTLISLNEEVVSLHGIYEVFKGIETKYKKINFQSFLKRISDLSKKAYSELVLAEFQQKLDNEYYNLSEKRVSEFGVTLTPKSNRAIVELEPQVGNHMVKKVLSEGEQKVHALALFFTETHYENKNIIVFDDPVTSLDYNYVATFCERIRNFISENPEKQIIVFTHDWYFLKDLQKTLNDDFSQVYNVQILEDCTTITENIEAIDKLKQKIQSTFDNTAPFDQIQKDMVAKYLRRLIEAVVNVHVFNETRTQFKRDNIKVSVFSEYTKLTPLLEQEANKLRDMYRKLSPWEHDDPRSIFTNSDKAVFQNRYTEICGVEASILSRK